MLRSSGYGVRLHPATGALSAGYARNSGDSLTMKVEYQRLLDLVTGTPGATIVLRDAHDLAQTGYHSAAQLIVAGVADTIAEAHPDQIPATDVLTLNRVLQKLFLEA